MRDGSDTIDVWHILESGVRCVRCRRRSPSLVLIYLLPRSSNSILAHVPWFGLLFRRLYGGSRERLRTFAREAVKRYVTFSSLFLFP
jgi:hypothetical protein